MSLFFDDRRQAVTADEAAKYEADAGRRLLDYLKGVASHALANLPSDARDWLKVPSMEPPGWHDPAEPVHLMNEAHRLFMALPAALPAWWNLDEEQGRAAAVLVAIGAAVRATRGLPPAPALRLLNASLLLGVTVTRAHVEPWEPIAATGKKQRDGGDKGRTNKTADAKLRHAHWQKMAEEEWKEKPRWSIKQTAEKVAKRLEEEKCSKPPSPDTVRNVITKPKK